MNDKLFAKLWNDALVQPQKDMYIAEYGYPDWFDDISSDMEKVFNTLGNIHDIAHMSVKDLISVSGLTQSDFAIKFCIPLRTIENWATQKRQCADYIRLSIARQLGLIN